MLSLTKISKYAVILLPAVTLLGLAGRADAALSPFQVYTGNVGVSTDGCGSTTQRCTVRANVPVGSTVVSAFLYSSVFFDNPPKNLAGSALNSSPLTFTPLGRSGPLDLQAYRADVTSIVASIINSGPGGIYNFTSTETSFNQDGSALVVVYTNDALSAQTVAILDGFTNPAGDTSTINFATPLTPSAPGFVADMRLGIGFSANGRDPKAPSGTDQVSEVRVNGTLISAVAGHCDDARDAACANGNLITVGSFDDPFTPTNPTVAQDHERYNLASILTDGTTSITTTTRNASADDNIFLQVFQISGVARDVNGIPPTDTTAIPEPTTMAGLTVAGAFGAFMKRRRSKQQAQPASTDA